MNNKQRLNTISLIESQQEVNGRYQDLKRLDENGGNGFFSIMFTGYDKTSKHRVALKFFDPEKMSWDGRFDRFRREAEMLESLRGEPYVLDSLEGLCRCSILARWSTGDGDSYIELPFEFFYIPMILADCSVENLILAQEQPQPIQFLKIFKEMVKGVHRIHRRNIFHRDLKPNNFLLKGANVLVSDFGTAKCLDGITPPISIEYSIPLGDLRYSAPEVRSGLAIGDERAYGADFFSLGAILFEMFTKSPLHYSVYPKSVLSKISLIKKTIEIQSKDENKIKVYLGIIDDVAKTVKFPDIFSYNNFVPGSIKNHLDDLYKSLASFNFKKRLKNFQYVHRKLDICIKILSNEDKYAEWIQNRNRRRLARIAKGLEVSRGGEIDA